MTIEQIRNMLRDRRVNIVAQETGVHPNTVRNIRDGGNPNAATAAKLAAYLSKSAAVQYG